MEKRTDWLTIINTMIGLFLVGLAVRTLVIALPTVAQGLSTDLLGVSWALIAYQVAGTGLGVVLGQLGDVFSHQRIYIFGLLIATVSALLCGLSQNITELVLFRFFQGVGGTIIHTAGRTLAMEAVPEGSEGKAQGMMAMAHQFGFFVGPPIGGLIIDWGSWRGIFFFMVPFGLAAMLLTQLSKRAPREKTIAGRHKVDFGGAALFMVWTLIMTLLLDQKTAILSGSGPKGMLALGVVGMTWGLWAHECKAASPMLDPHIFKLRFFTYGVVGLLAVCIVQGLTTFLMPFYMQGVLGLSASFMGVLFLVPSVLTVVLAPASGHLNDRVGSRIPMLIGLSFFIAALVMGANLRTSSHWMIPTTLLGLVGVGSALFNVPIQTASVLSFPKERWGNVTGIINTIFGLGHLLGISIGGLLLTLAFQHYSGVSGASPGPDDPIAFSKSINFTFAVAAGIAMIAVFATLKRGEGRGQRSIASTTEK